MHVAQTDDDDGRDPAHEADMQRLRREQLEGDGFDASDIPDDWADDWEF